MELRIPLFRSKRTRPFASTLALVAVLVFSVTPARHARAQTVDQILGQFQEVQNAMIQAAVHSHDGNAAETLASIGDALAVIQSIRNSLADPAAAAELGKKLKKVQKRLNGTEKKINRARVFVEKGGKAKIQLKKLKVGAKSALKSASKLGRPVVAELNARSAGFHKPEQQVRFQIYTADGSPCLEPPLVEVANQPFSRAIDSFRVDEGSGVITLTMGQEQGGGSITVTACGRTATVLVYNYGPKVPKGLPNGFPTNLPKGTYRITYSASGTGISIPETSLGTFELVDLKSFSQQLVNTFNTAINSVSVPGCSQRMSYSPYNGSFFRVTYSVTCTSGEYSATATIVFRIQKV
jgi:hypothetical protein